MVVLAIGSTKQIVFEGGPRPLLEKHSGFQKTLTIENRTVASNRPIKLASGLKDDVYVFEVICKEIGETDAIFQIGNTKISEQSQPIIRIKVVRVICSEPYQMYFKVESSLKSKCPVDSAQVVRVAVANYEPTLVSVIVKDKEGRKFDNITSLKMDWKSKPEYLDFATLTFAVTEPVVTGLGYLDTGKGN
jgi:nuclear pore complex protein Nup210